MPVQQANTSIILFTSVLERNASLKVNAIAAGIMFYLVSVGNLTVKRVENTTSASTVLLITRNRTNKIRQRTTATAKKAKPKISKRLTQIATPYNAYIAGVKRPSLICKSTIDTQS